MTRLFKKRHKNNPYSSRGLDTFEALLLERKKIYTKNDDDPGGGVSLVRFGYSSSSSNNLVPIVVKNKNMNVTKSDVTRFSSIEESKDINDDDKLSRLRIRPSYYMPVILMVLLVLLVFFGRTVAIIFMSIGWYIVSGTWERFGRGRLN